VLRNKTQKSIDEFSEYVFHFMFFNASEYNKLIIEQIWVKVMEYKIPTCITYGHYDEHLKKFIDDALIEFKFACRNIQRKSCINERRYKYWNKIYKEYVSVHEYGYPCEYHNNSVNINNTWDFMMKNKNPSKKTVDLYRIFNDITCSIHGKNKCLYDIFSKKYVIY